MRGSRAGWARGRACGGEKGTWGRQEGCWQALARCTGTEKERDKDGEGGVRDGRERGNKVGHSWPISVVFSDGGDEAGQVL